MFLSVRKSIVEIVSARDPGTPNHQVQTSSEMKCGATSGLINEMWLAIWMYALGTRTEL